KFLVMKSVLLAFLLSIVVMLGAVAQNPVVTVSGSITTNTTWTPNNVYLLQGFVYVKSGATLTIEPGTIIKGDKLTKGSLIITRGGKIIADGTASMPIVFTSNEPAGERTYGDWGGLIILGRAPVNKPGNEAEIEGGVNNASGDGLYGGTDPNDNSGILRYVRVEFSGIAFTDNNEINGITMGSVGSGTIIDHVQVSYCGDDSFEWFGGTVNAKHLISYRAWDDDLDTDFGFNGNVQFAVVLRDPDIADQSSSNAFESDNDGSGTANTPLTAPTFSNVTVVGPVLDAGNTINPLFRRAAHIRRNSRCSIYNSALMGFPTGLLLDGSATQAAATAGDMQIRNTTIVCTNANNLLTVESGGTYDVAGWYNTPAFGNQTATTIASQMITDPQNLDTPNFLPMTGSPLLSGADFSSPRLSGNFFTPTTYRGAFGNTDWTAGWANWDPQNTAYDTNTGVENILNIVNNQSIQLAPNPAQGNTTLQFDVVRSANISITISDLSGRTVKNVFSGAIQTGNHAFNIDTHELNPGMYLLQIINGGSATAAKLVVK
ncbi:MAG TPA: T9SS type A sorting domain-containing protein, partial [Chitinophagales bacterium]|nr:T9SS type A sorting domain-containing protein [Chitinophagales bacterium]